MTSKEKKLRLPNNVRINLSTGMIPGTTTTIYNGISSDGWTIYDMENKQIEPTTLYRYRDDWFYFNPVIDTGLMKGIKLDLSKKQIHALKFTDGSVYFSFVRLDEDTVEWNIFYRRVNLNAPPETDETDEDNDLDTLDEPEQSKLPPIWQVTFPKDANLLNVSKKARLAPEQLMKSLNDLDGPTLARMLEQLKTSPFGDFTLVGNQIHS